MVRIRSRYQHAVEAAEAMSGDTLHDFAINDAIAAGVADKGLDNGDGNTKTGAQSRTVNLKG